MATHYSLSDGNCEALLARHVPPARKKEITCALRAIHAQFAQEREAGLDALKANQRAWTVLHEQETFITDSLAVAKRVREGFSTFVHVGIGGSDLGPRVCHEVLNGTLHNESDKQRGQAPKMYFAGDTFDPRPLRELLEHLKETGELATTAFNIVSKSGKTPETLSAFLAIKKAIAETGNDWLKQMIFTTGLDRESILYRLVKAEKAEDRILGLLPVPDGVGGRFSVPSPVGLLPLAVTAGPGECPEARVRAAMDGFELADGCGRLEPFLDEKGTVNEGNFAYRLATWLQYAEEQLGIGSLVLYDYSACRMLGDWLVQLYTESIQERGGGLNIIAGRGPTSNHSLLNGVVGGPRDKVVLFLHWDHLGADLHVPEDVAVGEDLRIFMGKDMTALNEASFKGTSSDFGAQGIPALTLNAPARDTESLFFVMRVLMDTVAVKGRLQGLHVAPNSEIDFAHDLTYRQWGVEGYKDAMRGFLAESSD